MKNYRFETTTTMKDYNCQKWWIEADIVRPVIINAENLKEALKQYQEYTNDSYIIVSGNALKNKQPMYIDTATGAKQIGYVITGKTDFQRDDYSWSSQYIDLWVKIEEVNDLDFDMEIAG